MGGKNCSFPFSTNWTHCNLVSVRMLKLIKPSSERLYVDLTLSFAPETDGDDDLPGPPVRYYFSQGGEMP